MQNAHKVFDPYTELSHSSSAEQIEKPLSGFSKFAPVIGRIQNYGLAEYIARFAVVEHRGFVCP